MALYFNNREEGVYFLKCLWSDRPLPCPKCRAAVLTYLHKRAKKSSSDWKCPACGEIYRTIKILDELNETMK